MLGTSIVPIGAIHHRSFNRLGEDNMIMGSDYGHQDQSTEDGMVAVMRRKKSITPAVIEKILCDKPRRFYGL